MSRRLAGFLSFAVATLAGAALVAIAAFVVLPRLETSLERQATQAFGRAVHIGSVSLSVLPAPAVRLQAVEIADDVNFGNDPFVTLAQADIRVRFKALLRGDLVIDSVRLQQPHLRIVQHADGRMNVDTLGTPSSPNAAPASSESDSLPPALLAEARTQVDGGVVTFVSLGADNRTTEYDIDDLALTVTVGSPVAFVGKGRLEPGDIGLDISAGTIATDGASQLTSAPLRAQVTLGASDITDLAAAVMGAAPAINGGIKGTLAVAGTLARPTAAGTIEMPRVAITRTSPECPQPRRRTLMLSPLRVDAAWDNERFMGRPAMTAIDNGTITSSLVVTFGRAVHVEFGDLTVTALPLQKILVDFLCAGHAITGPLDLSGELSFDAGGTASGAASGLASIGQIRIGRGQVVGPQALDLLAGIVRVGGAVSALLSADLPWSLFSSPLDFDSIGASYQIANGRVHVHDLRYVSEAMKISGAGSYEFATDALDLDLVVNHGRGQVYAKVTGSAASPSIRVRPTTILRDIDPEKIGHGVQDLFRRLF